MLIHQNAHTSGQNGGGGVVMVKTISNPHGCPQPLISLLACLYKVYKGLGGDFPACDHEVIR